MLTPETLDRIISAVDNEALSALHRMAAGRGPLDGSNLDTDFALAKKDINAARATLAAMRTPITAEALVQAGWTRVYVSSSALWFSAARRAIYATAGYPGFEISIWEDGETELYYKTAKNCGSTLPMPSNMHDLSELVRLLGAK
jgi:hypothetical protein